MAFFILYRQNARRANVRAESLRRPHLAAQHGETLFFSMRPLAAADDASLAPLWLSVTPAHGGIDVGFVKRQGPRRDGALFIPMSVSPTVRYLPKRHVLATKPFEAGFATRSGTAAMMS